MNKFFWSGYCSYFICYKMTILNIFSLKIRLFLHKVLTCKIFLFTLFGYQRCFIYKQVQIILKNNFFTVVGNTKRILCGYFFFNQMFSIIFAKFLAITFVINYWFIFIFVMCVFYKTYCMNRTDSYLSFFFHLYLSEYHSRSQFLV